MAEEITIDIWGQILGESDNYRCAPPDAIEIDAPAEGEGVIYKRYYNETPCAIHRETQITSGGRMTIQKEFAYDDYGNRESATYYPIDAQPHKTYRQEIYYSGGTQTVAASAGSAFSQVLSGGTLRYGSEPALYFESSYHGSQATITSDGTISGTFTSAGTYNITAFLTAELAKPVPVSIVITVTA
jgi:hypothetical protein